MHQDAFSSHFSAFVPSICPNAPVIYPRMSTEKERIFMTSDMREL